MQLGPKNSGTSGAGNSSGNANYNRRPEPEHDMPTQTNDIPIIEENYTPPANDSAEDQKTVSFEDSAADEIDVKDIPF